MARIQLYNQTTKTSGKIKLRFRLRDGRSVQLYHKSEIEADINDLNKFEADGTPKKRANFNRELATTIKDRISLMQLVYDNSVKDGIELTKDSFEEEIDRKLHPANYKKEETENLSLSFMFEQFINNNSFSDVRTREYKVMLRNLKRFLIITDNSELSISEFTPQHISELQYYLTNEYLFASQKQYSYLFADVNAHNFPKKPSKQNTVQSKLKMIKAFYAHLEEIDKIQISPFRKLGKAKRSEMLKEEYVPPVALTKEEIRKILTTDVTPNLQAVKDAFLLQCALGCRINDFSSMNMDYIKVNADGIPFVTYVAHKTGMRTETPLVRFAFDIIRRTNFNLPILRYVSGQHGYNKKIKELLKYCDINREVEIGRDGSKLIFAPIHEVASSKTGRKTNVTLCADAQIDKAIMGLHEQGSKAISAYDAEGIMRKFKIVSFAFGEETYQVDQDLNVISQ